jgi:hypothetical protein
MNTVPIPYQRSQAWAEARRLASEAKALWAGLPPFDVLTLSERIQQLVAIMSDDVLIALAGDEATPPELLASASLELADRLGIADERDEVESLCEQMDAAEEPERWDAMA